jgi:hypothetical protein
MPTRKQADKMYVQEAALQPWFLPAEVYLELRRVLPPTQIMKMRYYFEDFGCLRCDSNTTIYGSNGLCEKCSVLIRGRVSRALKRRMKSLGELGRREPVNDLRRESANELLRRLPK